MKRIFLAFGLMTAGFLFCGGCSESEKTLPEAPASPPPQFTRAAEPRAFFDDYLADLGGERFLPMDLVELLTGQTDLEEAVKQVRRHHTLEFLEWYYADDYLEVVRKAVDQKLERMEYQLGILEVSKEDAAPVLMVVHSGVLEQKQIYGEQNFSQEWEEGEEAFRIRMAGGGQETFLLLFREQEGWRLGVLGKAVEVSD